MTKVLYPASFDPITKGHMDVVEKAENLFDKVVLAVLVNPDKKNPFFTAEERVEIIKNIYKDDEKIEVIKSDGLAVDVARENDCKGLVRGIRSVKDCDYELGITQVNSDLDSDITTICFFPKPEYGFVSSSMVKEVFSLGRDISKYVDSEVLEKMEAKKKVKKHDT